MNENNIEGYEEENKDEYREENKDENEEESEDTLRKKLSSKESIGYLVVFLLICLVIVVSNDSYGYREGAQTNDIQIQKATKQSFVQYEVKVKENFKDIWKDNVVGYNYEAAVKLILENNKLKPNESLYKGQLLYVPTMTNPGCSIYTVKKGDTIYSIADKFHMHTDTENSIKRIKETNGNVDTAMLEVGQNLLIPED